MFMRLVHRLCHFMIYACLFICRMASYKIEKVRNTLKWSIIKACSGLQQDDLILATRCVSGQLLGAKRLNHAALIVNDLHKELNLPT